MSSEERIEDDKMMQSEDRHAGCHIISEASNIRCEHLLTSSCGPVGTGAGTLTVLVETVVDVAVCVRVCVCVCVAVAVSCTVEVTVTGGSWPTAISNSCFSVVRARHESEQSAPDWLCHEASVAVKYSSTARGLDSSDGIRVNHG